MPSLPCLKVSALRVDLGWRVLAWVCACMYVYVCVVFVVVVLYN